MLNDDEAILSPGTAAEPQDNLDIARPIGIPIPFPPPSGPVLLFTIIVTISVLIMLPTAAALYYSKCLNISLLMGFGILFSTLITSLFSLILPDTISGSMTSTTGFAWGIITIYCVITMMLGGCNF
jgi:hypothetical protein|tara:strand:+ start:207 stop:584 length:378 start_codon:yes stop_codon:yes gene_type:complete